MSEVVGPAPEPMRFRPASRRRWWTVGLAAATVLQVVSLAYLVATHRSTIQVVLQVLLCLAFGVQLVQLLSVTTVDAIGVHTRWRTQPWGDVRGVRVSRWADTVILELAGGQERRLALPASDGERVAALAGVPLITPPRL